MKVIANVGYGLRGTVQASVVQNGIIVREFPPVRNLILNNGLDAIASYTFSQMMDYAVAGTGTTATEINSGADTITIAAGTVTLSNTGYLTGDANDVGRSFKCATSGNVYKVTSFISTTQCVVSPGGTEGPDTFTLYQTNQTGLTAEVKRTNTYLTGAPNCQTITVVNLTTMTRTYDFSAEGGSITYNEVGFSRTASSGANLFSRIKLPAGVALVAGQQLRLKYSLQIGVSPTSPLTYGTSPIVGWPTGTGTLQCLEIPIGYIQTNGIGSSGGLNSIDSKYYEVYGEPSYVGGYPALWISTSSAAHTSYGAAASVAGTTAALAFSLSTYTNGTYTRDKSCTFPVGSANRSDWRSFFLGQTNGNTLAYKFLFDSNQEKLSTYTLTLGFRLSWNRQL
jgi:hypothetical protein